MGDVVPELSLTSQAVYVSIIPEFFTYSRTKSDSYRQVVWTKYSYWPGANLEVYP